MKRHLACAALPAALAAIALLVAPAPLWSAWPTTPLQGLRIAPFAADQSYTKAVSDGAGGAIVVFLDRRNGAYDVFVQRVTVTGEIAPGWPASGLALCTAGGDQFEPLLVPDGAGGAVVTWQDYRSGNADVYVARVTANGALSPGWPANGLQMTSDARPEFVTGIAPDGQGGAFLVWMLEYAPATDLDVWAGRVDSGGFGDWVAPIATPSAFQHEAHIAADGAGGVLISYSDDIAGSKDIRVVRRGSDGSPIYGPVTVCDQPDVQTGSRVLGIGNGRAIAAWWDFRSGTNFDIYATVLTESGDVDFGLDLDGTPVCTASGNQEQVLLASDGSGGAYLTWRDHRGVGWDVFVHRFLGTGVPHPGWPVNGVGACTLDGHQYVQDLDPDGLGGAILTWADWRLGSTDTYALRLLPSGNIAPGWVSGGTPVTMGGSAGFQSAAVDPTGNSVLAFVDIAPGAFNVYAQRVEVFGQLANPEPSIAAIRDVTGDQGGRVRLDWTASYLDANPTFGVGAYWVWRQAPAAKALHALERGGRLLSAADASGDATAVPDGGLWMTTAAGATTYYWEFLASVPASGFPTYSYVAATTTDSTAGANPYTPYMVQARAPSGPAYWSSTPDSGYSVDNLPPSAPEPFTGVFEGGRTFLHWGANTESDLAGYRLYRGGSAEFVPGPGNLVSEQPDTGYVDTDAPGSWYKLSAVDTHDNESLFAVLEPVVTVDVTNEVPLVLALAPARPNPAARSASFQLALPAEGRVRLIAYDARGRRVRTLVNGALPAGYHEVAWNLADDGGRALASGRYFVRLEANGGVLVQPVTVVR